MAEFLEHGFAIQRLTVLISLPHGLGRGDYRFAVSGQGKVLEVLVVLPGILRNFSVIQRFNLVLG